MAFVVVPHRGSSEPLQLTQVLSRATSMATCEIEHGMRLRANCVFVLPPGFQLTLSDARFVLSKTRERHGWPTTLSVFLCSLAESLGSRAIAVILSGLGNDGASALATVKAAGGQTFAQADARWMPDGAVATGNIDFTMTPAEIANALSALSQMRQSPLPGRDKR
jgi:two-component system CheB/CheR fusion protein